LSRGFPQSVLLATRKDKATAEKLALDKAAAEKVVAELKLTQEAEAKGAAELKAKQEVEAQAAAANTKTTITCVKDKLIKKVSAVRPKCPTGYK
jgi:hypothetical protein